MSVSKLFISKKLIEGYEGAPPLLKEQALTKLAIQLCQKVELTEFNELALVRPRVKNLLYQQVWNILNKRRATGICGRLPLPRAIKNLLIVRIRPIALQLFSWNRQYQIMFDFPSLFAYTFVTPSDWTVEGRLDENKIAERLVQDERIPVFQRYRIACWYCLKLFIHSLWSEIPPEQRQTAFDAEKSKLVQLWSYQIAGKVEELIMDKDMFWQYVLKYGVSEGSRPSVLFSCCELQDGVKENVLDVHTTAALQKAYEGTTANWMNYLQDNEWLAPPSHYTDISFFLVTQMSEEQKIEFFQEELLDVFGTRIFTQWPYLDLLIPFFKNVWDIIPDEYYSDNFIHLAYRYINPFSDVYFTEYSDYVNYYYGALLMELLDETPDHFKRYMFSDTKNSKRGRKLLSDLITLGPLDIRTTKIFQHIFKHLTLEEKRSFLKSEHGYAFCGNFAMRDNWQVLDWTLRESFAEDDVIKFKMEFARSVTGETVFCCMLKKRTEVPLISWLNWGFSSKEEIVQFMFKMFIKDDRLNDACLLKEDFSWSIEMNCFNNVIKIYAPSLHAGRKFKTIFVRKYSRHLCINFIIHSKWQEVDLFLTWCFQSESARTKFKKYFAKEHGMYICEHHLKNSRLQEAERFLTWCLPSKWAVKKFKQELFFFSGVQLQWDLLSRYLPDDDSLIKWFRLNPDAALKFRKDVLFRSSALGYLFDMLSDALIFEWEYGIKLISEDILYCMDIFLKWGLPDEKTFVAFKDLSKMYLMGVPFSNIKNRQLIQQSWDELLSKRLSDLST